MTEQIVNSISETSNFILVSNYKAKKSIHNDGFIYYDSLIELKDNYTVGFWRIKRK